LATGDDVGPMLRKRWTIVTVKFLHYRLLKKGNGAVEKKRTYRENPQKCWFLVSPAPSVDGTMNETLIDQVSPENSQIVPQKSTSVDKPRCPGAASAKGRVTLDVTRQLAFPILNRSQPFKRCVFREQIDVDFDIDCFDGMQRRDRAHSHYRGVLSLSAASGCFS